MVINHGSWWDRESSLELDMQADVESLWQCAGVKGLADKHPKLSSCPVVLWYVYTLAGWPSPFWRWKWRDPMDEHHPTKAVSCLASLSLHYDGVPFSLLYESSWPVALSCGGWVPSDIATTWSSWESTYLGAPMYTQVLFSLYWLLRPHSFFTRQRHMREQWRTGHHCSFEHGRQTHRDTSRELNIGLWTSVFSKVSLGTQKYPP